MIYEWPIKPISCFLCYDLGIVIDPFDQSKRVECECQKEIETTADQIFLQFLWSKAGQLGDMHVQ